MNQTQSNDITQNNLALAMLDQNVAGQFTGKRYAYIAVPSDSQWELGIVVQSEPGYHPITGGCWATKVQAQEIADGMNAHIGLSENEVLDITISTMRRGS